MRPPLVCLLALAAALPAARAACGDELPAGSRQLAQAAAMQLAFAPRPGPIAVGQHFALDIVLCRPAGTPPPASLRVDADMPAHRHGMNYRATVEARGGDRYAAQGLMFHMPGRWRLLFDVDGERLVHEFDVE